MNEEEELNRISALLESGELDTFHPHHLAIITSALSYSGLTHSEPRANALNAKIFDMYLRKALPNFSHSKLIKQLAIMQTDLMFSDPIWKP